MLYRMLPAIVLVLAAPTLVRAHYLWITVTGQGDDRAVRLVFEESPRPGDGGYLDPIVKRGQSWLREPGAKTADLVKLPEVQRDGKRWLQAGVKDHRGNVAESYVKWGVYKYGKNHALLHYYARHIEVPKSGKYHPAGYSKKFALQVDLLSAEPTPTLSASWRGMPLANYRLNVVGPRGFLGKQTTDARGRLELKDAQPGAYRVRVTITEPNQPGVFEGKKYDQIRHSATLTFTLPK